MSSISEIKQSLISELGLTTKKQFKALENGLRAAFRLPSRNPSDPNRIKLILLSCATNFGLTLEQLVSSSRSSECVRGRAAAYHFLKKEGTLSPSEIMKQLNRDRSLCRNIQNNLAEFVFDKDFKTILAKIENETRI